MEGGRSAPNPISEKICRNPRKLATIHPEKSQKASPAAKVGLAETDRWVRLERRRLAHHDRQGHRGFSVTHHRMEAIFSGYFFRLAVAQD
jgi:hypothetical protein